MENKELTITYEKSTNYFETVACDFSSATTSIGITKLYFIDEDTSPTSATITFNDTGTIQVNKEPTGRKIINGCVTIPTARIPDLITLLQSQYNISKNPPKGDE